MNFAAHVWYVESSCGGRDVGNREQCFNRFSIILLFVIYDRE